MSDLKTKEYLLRFLQKGCCSFDCVTERDECYEGIISDFPLLKHIIQLMSLRDTDGRKAHALYANDNWFWQKSNSLRQDALYKDIEALTFTPTDANYARVVERMGRDAYGIVKPIKRNTIEPLNEKRFEKACGILFLLPSQVKSFSEDGYCEVIYCGERGKSRLELEEWITCEKMLKEPLNFEEYKVVDQVFFGSSKELIADYGTFAFVKGVDEMRTTLNNYRAKRYEYAKNLVEDIIGEALRGSMKIAAKKYMKLFSMYEIPAGCCSDNVITLKSELEDLLGNIPQSIKSDLEKKLTEGV